MLFSYLFPFTLQYGKGVDGTNLKLYLKNGRLSLHTPNAIYSDEADYPSFKKAFQSINIKENKPSSILILGYGLGSISKLLRQLSGSAPRITGVEYDSQVITWAKKFTDMKHIDLQQADVLDYINQCKSNYQLVCMDIYVDHVVPERCWTIESLHQLKKLISPGGRLLYSTLEMRSKQTLRVLFEQRFKKVFTDFKAIDTGGNLVYYWENIN